MVRPTMQSPAIQVALNNLVETIRTSLMAEFLELLRSGKPARGKPGPKPRQLSTPKKGGRRSADDVEQVGNLIVAHLKKNPDSKVESIASALGNYSSKDLALPIKKLLADKVIVKKGERRGTTYRSKG
jgi:hypothetical protein